MFCLWLTFLSNIGKTNLHELSLGVTSKNYFTGAVRNPADRSLFSGGSSGGTAAAIAAGFVKVGLGTDNMGSVRIPAALCGVYGYRPTVNRYPSEGVVTISHTRDTIGLLADNLEDIELFDSIITTGSHSDERSHSPGFYGTLYRYGDKIRLGVSKFYFFLSLSKEVNMAVENILQKLSTKNNIELVNADMMGIERLVKKDNAIMEHELNIDLPKFLKDYNTGVSFDDLVDEIASPDVERIVGDSREKFASGKTESLYQEALEERATLKDFYETFFDKHRLDAIIYPTTPLEAKPTDDCESRVLMDGRNVNTYKTFIQNTSPGSYAGIPSISLPLAKTSSGLPIGIQLETLENHDRLLFEIAGVVRDAVVEEVPSISITDDSDDLLI